MKLFILTFPVLILLILFTHKSVAQCPIPNAGFENWTDGDLDNWDELEVMEALETHSGNSAAQLLRGPVGIFPSFLFTKFPCSQKSDYLNGYIKANFNLSDDTLIVTAYYSKAGESGLIAAGSAFTNTNRSSFEPFYLPIADLLFDQVDTVYLMATFTAGHANVTLDDLTFSDTPIGMPIGSPVTSNTPYFENGSISEPTISIAPNPAKAVAKVAISGLSPDQTEVTLTDLSGKQIRSLYKGKGDPSLRLQLDVKGLHSGVYLVRAMNGKGVITKKIVVE